MKPWGTPLRLYAPLPTRWRPIQRGGFPNRRIPCPCSACCQILTPLQLDPRREEGFRRCPRCQPRHAGHEPGNPSQHLRRRCPQRSLVCGLLRLPIHTLDQLIHLIFNFQFLLWWRRFGLRLLHCRIRLRICQLKDSTSPTGPDGWCCTDPSRPADHDGPVQLQGVE